jgi:Cu/Ag efflux pump CusA
VLVGLACKNAILIVEFARDALERGLSPIDAAIEACRLRLRPILMTSFAFIMGVVPLVTATGAGSEMRQAIGIAVFSGMLGVTLFGLFLTPVFFVTIENFGGKRPVAEPGPAPQPGSGPAPEPGAPLTPVSSSGAVFTTAEESHRA